MLPLKIASSGGKWWPEELDKGVAGRVHGSSVDYTMVTRYILWLEIMVYWEPLNMWFTVAFAYRSHKFVKPSALEKQLLKYLFLEKNNKYIKTKK